MKIRLTHFTPAERLAIRSAVAAHIAADRAIDPAQYSIRFQRTRHMKSMFKSLRGSIINARGIARPCKELMQGAESLQGYIEALTLTSVDGPVTIYDDQSGCEVERFNTIAAAESFLSLSATIDPDKLFNGVYSINAPHGLGADSEARLVAEQEGFVIFPSMGSFYYTVKGTPVSGNVSGKGWSKSFESSAAAALAALATVEP